MDKILEDIYTILAKDLPPGLEPWHYYVTYFICGFVFMVVGARVGWHRDNTIGFGVMGLIAGLFVSWLLVSVALLKRAKQEQYYMGQARYIVQCLVEPAKARIFADQDNVWLQYDPAYAPEFKSDPNALNAETEPEPERAAKPAPRPLKLPIKTFAEVDRKVIRPSGLRWPQRTDAPPDAYFKQKDR